MNRLLLTWSWRDLRSRWVQVLVIALVVGLGTGMYAGLMSNVDWGRMSYDESFARLNMYDLEVSLAAGSFADEGELVDLIENSELASEFVAAEERLLTPTQLDVVTPKNGNVIVRGLLMGVSVVDGQPRVNGYEVMEGRALEPSDASQPTVILEHNFARFYELPPEGNVTLAGGQAVEFIGQGLTPEFFIVQPPEGGFFSQAEYGVVITSLGTAQTLSGFGGLVNDLLALTAQGVDPSDLGPRLQVLLDEAVPELGATVTLGTDNNTYRLMYDDLDGDQQFFGVFAILILIGAVVAAFNLTNRMVEANRREIGIAMALGARRRTIAMRPLLVGSQIALLGVVFGIGVGFLVNAAMKSVLAEFVPLPVWLTPFRPTQFALAATLGFVTTFVAVVVPVWRALRVPPIEAIRTGHLAVRGAGTASWLRRLPGDSMTKIPFRNIMRAPRRTVLTSLGIGASITVLVGMVVMIDSYTATIDFGAEEVTSGAPDRIVVGLDTFHIDSEPGVTSVIGSPSVAAAESILKVPAVAIASDGTEIELIVEIMDLDSDLWHPSVVSGRASTDGILISTKAAKDLGVKVGDTVTIRHPQRQGLTMFSLVESDMVATGLHPHPFRFVAYLHSDQADLLGLAGVTNSVSINPAPGIGLSELQQELFSEPVVASVQRADGVAELIRDFIGQVVGILQVAEGASVLLILLIAFNSASVGFDERAREHATMMAYGVKRRTIMRMAVVESGTLGVLSTVVGMIGGVLFVRWAVITNVETTMPDIELTTPYTPALMALTAALGIVAVAVAPLLTWRKLRKTDIPSTLRIME
ncbi:MAG: FtsX-like permease family protein [Acidimicrobiia bacterium]|nr:FtsX-like permease family protein [Acidimicrobiia bacterium]